MKVIYETIERSIQKAVESADKHNRRIEYIELPWWEANELAASVRHYLYVSDDAYFRKYGPADYGKGKIVGQYMGVEVRVA